MDDEFSSKTTFSVKTESGEKRVMTPEEVNEFVRQSIVRAASKTTPTAAIPHLTVSFNRKPTSVDQRIQAASSPVQKASSRTEKAIQPESRSPEESPASQTEGNSSSDGCRVVVSSERDNPPSISDLITSSNPPAEMDMLERKRSAADMPVAGAAAREEQTSPPADGGILLRPRPKQTIAADKSIRSNQEPSTTSNVVLKPKKLAEAAYTKAPASPTKQIVTSATPASPRSKQQKIAKARRKIQRSESTPHAGRAKMVESNKISRSDTDSSPLKRRSDRLKKVTKSGKRDPILSLPASGNHVPKKQSAAAKSPRSDGSTSSLQLPSISSPQQTTPSDAETQDAKDRISGKQRMSRTEIEKLVKHSIHRARQARIATSPTDEQNEDETKENSSRFDEKVTANQKEKPVGTLNRRFSWSSVDETSSVDDDSTVGQKKLNKPKNAAALHQENQHSQTATTDKSVTAVPEPTQDGTQNPTMPTCMDKQSPASFAEKSSNPEPPSQEKAMDSLETKPSTVLSPPLAEKEHHDGPISHSKNEVASFEVKSLTQDEISTIVISSMGRAQKSAREEVRAALLNPTGPSGGDKLLSRSQQEVASMAREAMHRAREIAQDEIRNLVRQSFRNAQEGEQEEIRQIVRDSMQKARATAREEMSDLVRGIFRREHDSNHSITIEPATPAKSMHSAAEVPDHSRRPVTESMKQVTAPVNTSEAIESPKQVEIKDDESLKQVDSPVAESPKQIQTFAVDSPKQALPFDEPAKSPNSLKGENTAKNRHEPLDQQELQSQHMPASPGFPSRGALLSRSTSNGSQGSGQISTPSSNQGSISLPSLDANTGKQDSRSKSPFQMFSFFRHQARERKLEFEESVPFDEGERKDPGQLRETPRYSNTEAVDIQSQREATDVFETLQQQHQQIQQRWENGETPRQTTVAGESLHPHQKEEQPSSNAVIVPASADFMVDQKTAGAIFKRQEEQASSNLSNPVGYTVEVGVEDDGLFQPTSYYTMEASQWSTCSRSTLETNEPSFPLDFVPAKNRPTPLSAYSSFSHSFDPSESTYTTVEERRRRRPRSKPKATVVTEEFLEMIASKKGSKITTKELTELMKQQNVRSSKPLARRKSPRKNNFNNNFNNNNNNNRRRRDLDKSLSSMEEPSIPQSRFCMGLMEFFDDFDVFADPEDLRSHLASSYSGSFDSSEDSLGPPSDGVSFSFSPAAAGKNTYSEDDETTGRGGGWWS